MNHLKIIKVTLKKLSLYKELRAPSGHDKKTYVHLVDMIKRLTCT
jgi:hypothetical protein